MVPTTLIVDTSHFEKNRSPASLGSFQFIHNFPLKNYESIEKLKASLKQNGVVRIVNICEFTNDKYPCNIDETTWFSSFSEIVFKTKRSMENFIKKFA